MWAQLSAAIHALYKLSRMNSYDSFHCALTEVKTVKRTLYKEETNALPEECSTFVSNKTCYDPPFRLHTQFKKHLFRISWRCNENLNIFFLIQWKET